MAKRRQRPAGPSSPALARAPIAARGGRGDRRGDGRVALLLGLLAAAHRALLVLSGDDRAWPYTVFYEGDSEAFFRFARSFLEGGLYDGGMPYHPPGFALLLAGLHLLLGAGAAGAAVPHLAVKLLLGSLVGGGGVAALYLATVAVLGRSTATLAALLAAWHFGLAVLSIAPVADGLFQLLLLAAVALFVRRLDFGARSDAPADFRAAALLGALLGALCLVRAEGLLDALALLGFGTVVALRAGARAERPRSAWRALRPWALAAAVGLLVVTPWAIRNAVRLGELESRYAGRLAEPLPRFVPVTIYGPLNLALANHAGADGGFSRAALATRAGEASLDLAEPEHLRFLLHGDAIAWTWIRDHPADFARLAGRKLALWSDALRHGFTQWNWPGGLAGVRRPVDVFVPDGRGPQLPLAALALVGAALLLRHGPVDPAGPAGSARRRFAALLLALVGCGLLTTIAFFGYARLGLVRLPLLLPFVAAALVRAVRRLAAAAPATWRARLDWGAARKAAWAAVVLLLALETVGAARGHRLEASGTTLPGSSRLDRDQPVRFRPLPLRAAPAAPPATQSIAVPK